MSLTKKGKFFTRFNIRIRKYFSRDRKEAKRMRPRVEKVRF